MSCGDINVIVYENSLLLRIDGRHLSDACPISSLRLFALPRLFEQLLLHPKIHPEKRKVDDKALFFVIGLTPVCWPDLRLAMDTRILYATAADSSFLTLHPRTRLTKPTAPQKMPRCTPKRLSLFSVAAQCQCSDLLFSITLPSLSPVTSIYIAEILNKIFQL